MSNKFLKVKKGLDFQYKSGNLNMPYLSSLLRHGVIDRKTYDRYREKLRNQMLFEKHG